MLDWKLLKNASKKDSKKDSDKKAALS